MHFVSICAIMILSGRPYMNTLELMDAAVSSFSKTDRRIYEMIRKFPEEFATSSITKVSDESEVTKPALTRFAKKLGFGGFAELQYQLAQDLKELKENDTKSSNGEKYASILKQTERLISTEEIRSLIRRMRSSRKVILAGANLSRLPAEEMLIALSFEDDICVMMPEPDMMPYHFSENDMVIIYSAISGNSHQGFLRNFRMENAVKPYLVLVTTNSKHPLRHNFDEVFCLPTLPLADTTNTVLSDTFAFLMFNDVIAQELRKQKHG